MSRLFQIYEQDLATLENALPQLQDAIGEAMNNPRVSAIMGELKDIMSNVRWNYGPYSEVRRVEPPREDA